MDCRAPCCCCLLLAATVIIGSAAEQRSLRFEHRKFRIQLFCDLHFGDSYQQDLASMQFEHDVLTSEKPNLVIIMGDVSSAYSAPDCAPNPQVCKEFNAANWQNATLSLEVKKIHHTFLLGNHDAIPFFQHADPGTPVDGFFVSPEEVMDIAAKNNYYLGPQDRGSLPGNSTYVLPVYSENGTSVLFYLWHFDSGINDCLKVIGHGCIDPDQVAWYRTTSRRLLERDGRLVPGMAFLHIPLPEVNDAWNEQSRKVFGTKGEDVCCSSVNTGLLTAAREMGNIFGIFYGHDHSNDFAARVDGVYLAYCRKSGFGGYNTMMPGTRVLELQEDPEAKLGIRWKTWITFQDGSTIRQKRSRHRVKQSRCAGMRDKDEL